MWRWFAIAAAFYAGGHPGLDAWRPAAFDRSLREFHRDVNRLGGDAVQVATGLDQARMLSQFGSLSEQFQTMLSGR
jgi:hypothetical protein